MARSSAVAKVSRTYVFGPRDATQEAHAGILSRVKLLLENGAPPALPKGRFRGPS
jgi:hypothetical protein